MLNVNKITGDNLYIANSSKENGSTLSAEEWNALSNAAALAHTTINSIIDAAGSGGSSSSDATGVVSVSSKGNTTISATKHINIEPAYVADGGTGTYGDVQIKPGDDITLESHHRASDKRDEITIKTSDGVDNSKAPVKLQMIASNITLSTKGKVVPSGSNDEPEVMNVNVTTGKGKGYLKVRARAIDLRCEDHGGVALQPKGYDRSTAEWKYRGMSSTGVFDSDEEAGTWYTITLGDVPALYDNKKYVIRFKNIHGTVAPQCYLECQDEDDNYIGGYTVSGTEIQLTQDDSDYIYELTPSDISALNNKVKKITLSADSVHFLTVFTSGNEVYLEEGYKVTGMNKLKFEHGGGDGLEFGTLNTEHTSIFTDDYRFNKNGVIRIATRSKVASDKADSSDTTTSYKYVKQNDDFYDVIDGKDPSCTWGDIVSMIHELKVMKANGKGPWASQP